MPKKILLVDDEPEILEICRDYLKASGFDVVTAKDGALGLSAARREKPDLVTLDLSMPGRSVGEVFEALRRDPELAKTRVCVITGKPELRSLIYERPVPPPDGFLDKPVSEEKLIFNVRKILEISEKQQ